MPLELQIFCVTPMPSLAGAVCLFVLWTAVKGWRAAESFLDSIALFHILTSMQVILVIFVIISEMPELYMFTNFGAILSLPVYSALLFPAVIFSLIQIASLINDVGLARTFGSNSQTKVNDSRKINLLSMKNRNSRAIALNFIAMAWQGLLIYMVSSVISLNSI